MKNGAWLFLRTTVMVGALGVLAPPGLLAREPAAEGPMIELPPLSVTASVRQPPWRYAEAPGLQVLSRCSDGTTREFVERIQQLQQLVRLMLPEEFEPRRALPRTILLTNEESTPTTARNVVDGAGARGTPLAGATERIRFLPNLALDDRDEVSVYAIVNERRPDAGTFVFAPEHMKSLLARQAPPLPPWLAAGIMELYNTARFTRNEISFGPVGWLPAAEAEELRKNPEAPRTLLPMAEFLALEPVDPAADDEMTQRWRAQAALFVCWALGGEDPARREKFWQLVRQAMDRPVTAEIFQECLGLSFADARDRLSDFLPGAAGSRFHLHTEAVVGLKDFKLRMATENEVARLKGNWERLEIGYVRIRHPEYVARYREQALRTLGRAYDRGDRDPRLLAVLGLLHGEIGDDGAARMLLEPAAQAQVERPRIYHELARIRYAAARTGPKGASGLLSAAQAEDALTPLGWAHGRLPPAPEFYVLAADVWLHTEAVPGPAQRQYFDEALRLFPRQWDVVHAVAVLDAARGRRAEALALAERGVRQTPPGAAHERFVRLRDLLQSTVGVSAEKP